MQGRALGLGWTQSPTFQRMMAKGDDFRRFALATQLWIGAFLQLQRKLEKKSHAAMNQERLVFLFDFALEIQKLEMPKINPPQH